MPEKILDEAYCELANINIKIATAINNDNEEILNETLRVMDYLYEQLSIMTHKYNSAKSTLDIIGSAYTHWRP